MAASDLFDMFTQSIKFYTFHYQYRCLKNVIHQRDSKNGWLLLSTSFTAKFGLAFVLTLESTLSQRFHFQVNRKSIGSSKKRLKMIEKVSFPYKTATLEANVKTNRMVTTKWACTENGVLLFDFFESFVSV